MELINLFKQQEQISIDILTERFQDIAVPGLQENIADYKEKIKDFAAALRQSGQLTHKGHQIKTKPDLKKICIAEGWDDLLRDMEMITNA